MTRFSDLSYIGQLFIAHGNNYIAEITNTLGNFCKGVEIFHYTTEILLGNIYRHFGDFLLVTLAAA